MLSTTAHGWWWECCDDAAAVCRVRYDRDRFCLAFSRERPDVIQFDIVVSVPEVRKSSSQDGPLCRKDRSTVFLDPMCASVRLR
jgi:hypothetical protein